MCVVDGRQSVSFTPRRRCLDRANGGVWVVESERDETGTSIPRSRRTSVLSGAGRIGSTPVIEWVLKRASACPDVAPRRDLGRLRTARADGVASLGRPRAQKLAQFGTIRLGAVVTGCAATSRTATRTSSASSRSPLSSPSDNRLSHSPPPRFVRCVRRVSPGRDRRVSHQSRTPTASTVAAQRCSPGSTSSTGPASNRRNRSCTSAIRSSSNPCARSASGPI